MAITLVAVADKYVVVSVEHAGDGGIAAKEIELALPELAFLKLGDFEVCHIRLPGLMYQFLINTYAPPFLL